DPAGGRAREGGGAARRRDSAHLLASDRALTSGATGRRVTGERIALRSVGVIGLGLIGGSIARDLHALGVHVRGYDRDGASLDRACGDGVVDQPLDASLSGLEDADAVIVAVPVSLLPDVLRAVADTTKARLI